jgi:rhomboid protease GluP
MNERVFKPRVTLWWAILLFAIGIVIGLLMILENAPAGWLVFLASLGFLLIGLSPLLTGKPRLRLNHAGFEVSSLFNTRFVPWGEVMEMGVYTLNSNRFIGYKLHRNPNATERQWTGYDGSIHNAGYTQTNQALLEILQAFKTQHDHSNDAGLLAQLEQLRHSSNLEAQFQIALKLTNTEQALELLRTLASKGHVGAQFELGRTLWDERGLDWMRLAMQSLGEYGEKARATLPMMLLEVGDDPNGMNFNSARLNEALGLLRQQAEAGSTQHQLYLGQLLSSLAQRDPSLTKEAMIWLEKAGQTGLGVKARDEIHRLNLPGWLKPFWGWPIATYGMLGLIVGVFILQWIRGGPSPSPQFLFDIGANVNIAVQNGEFWRLLTATILHGSLPHIAFNGFAMWQIGLQLERVAGTATTLTAFVVSGLMGSLFSGLLGNPQVVSVGASGGIFGLIAFLIVYGVHNTSEFVQRLRTQGWLLALYFLMSAFIPNVDNWGHFGGIVGGLALGLVYTYIPQMARWVLGGIAALALLWAFWRVLSLL